MTCVSTRFTIVRSLAACLAAGAALAAPTARADVLEIGPAGTVWVARSAKAGGPGPATDAPSPGIAARRAEDTAAYAPASFTGVEADAGPDGWRAHVGRLAAKYDISPALLEAVVWQESRWNARAVSPAGARGLAQLMPGTARQLGVDPGDPQANLEGGAQYLRMQLDRFDGNVEKALAAYNAGPGRVERAGGIPAIRETRDYVAAILARLSQPVRR